MLLEIILAIIPIAWLIISMAGLKMAGYKSCGIGLVIAIDVYKRQPLYSV